jgi:hypothetical protein
MADQQQGKGRPTGAGSEASEGIHGAGESRNEADKTSVTEDRSASTRNKGSEPLDQDRKNEHRSGYGGSGGAPVTSSDQREKGSGKQ